MQNFVAAVVVMVLSIGTYLQCFTESVFVLNPLIDTQLPEGFSKSNFDRIQKGMTKAEVLELLPPPPQGLKEIYWSYGNDGAAPFGDFAWYSFSITFNKEGKVAEKKQWTFYD